MEPPPSPDNSHHARTHTPNQYTEICFKVESHFVTWWTFLFSEFVNGVRNHARNLVISSSSYSWIGFPVEIIHEEKQCPQFLSLLRQCISKSYVVHIFCFPVASSPLQRFPSFRMRFSASRIRCFGIGKGSFSRHLQVCREDDWPSYLKKRSVDMRQVLCCLRKWRIISHNHLEWIISPCCLVLLPQSNLSLS